MRRIIHRRRDLDDFLALIAKESSLAISFRMKDNCITAQFIFDHCHGLF